MAQPFDKREESDISEQQDTETDEGPTIVRIAQVSSGAEEEATSRFSGIHQQIESTDESPSDQDEARNGRDPYRTHYVEDHGNHYVIKEREIEEIDDAEQLGHPDDGDFKKEFPLVLGEDPPSSLCDEHQEHGEFIASQEGGEQEELINSGIEQESSTCKVICNFVNEVQVSGDQLEEENTYRISADSGDNVTHSPPKLVSTILNHLPMVEIIDESGKISTLSDLPPGSQIVLDSGYKGLSDLPTGSRIIFNTGTDGTTPESDIPAGSELVIGQIGTEEQLVGSQTPSSTTGYQVVAEENGHQSLRDGVEILSESEQMHNEITPDMGMLVDTENLQSSNPDLDQEEMLDCTDTREISSNPLSKAKESEDDLPKAGRDSKQDWKWFRDSKGRKPSKYTCKVFDAVFATISLDLLHSLQASLLLGDFPDNCSLLEHLLVTKHHVTDLMIREDETELQLAGDLIDIMEVHNVLLGNVPDPEKCVHKPLQPCSAVVKDQGIMCSGVPQPTGRGGRKLKRLYTRDMYTHVPFREHPPDQESSAPSNPGDRSRSVSPEPETAGSRELDGRRTSRRVSRPPVKMDDIIVPTKKRRGRKPYKRPRIAPEAARKPTLYTDSDGVEKSSFPGTSAELKDLEAKIENQEALSEPLTSEHASGIQEGSPGNGAPPEDVGLVFMEVQGAAKPEDTDMQSVSEVDRSCGLSDIDPVVDRREILNDLDLLTPIKTTQSELSLEDVPMTTQTVDSFLPIIASNDAQSEDESLLGNHGASLQRKLDMPTSSTSQVISNIPEPLTLSRRSYKPKKKKKDYESQTPFKYFCNKCSFKTKRESHFHKHSLLHTEKNLPVLYCSRCDYSTLTLSRLRHHEVSHTPNALRCVVCSYTTISMPQLRKHHIKKHEMRSADLTMANEQKCDHCEYKTDKMHLFQRHQQCHAHVSGNKSGVKGMMIPTYACTHCSYNSRNKENFTRHMKNVHSDLRPYLCDLCGAGFKRKDTLKTHRLVHLDKGQRTYKHFCPHCKKGLRSKGHLDEHMSMHSSKRQYLCEICGASFKTRGIQRRHVYTIHKNPKSYPCETCKKNFNTKFALHRHNRTHEIAQLRGKNNQPADRAASEGTESNLSYMPVKQEPNLSMPPVSINESNIIHIQPVTFSDQRLGSDQVITELHVLPMDASLNGTVMSNVPQQDSQQMVPSLDSEDQKLEVQLQPALVQTSSGATTLLYLTTVPQDGT